MPTGMDLETSGLRRRVAAALLAGASVVAAAGISASPAMAGDAFYDASLALQISDDARFFLNVTNRYYGSSQQAVTVLNRCPNPGADFPVVMFLAQVSGRRADAVLSLRAKRLPWSEVMVRLQVPPDRLFAGLDRDPGPPYGHAWGHWKEHKRRGAKEPYAIDDVMVQDLVRLQVASGALRVNPFSIVADRQRGMSVDQFVVIHSQPSGAVPAKYSKSPRPERGQGHDQGHRKPRP